MSKTVNTWGQWTPFNSVKEYEKMPKSEWCDMDWIAYSILKRSERPNNQVIMLNTSLENVCEMVYAAIDDYEYTNVFNGVGGDGWTKDATIDQKINTIIDEHGGIREFDYKC